MALERKRNRRHLLILPLAALVAVLPLILHGCSCGHDFDFHLLSWLEAATQFSHGNLSPHWAVTPAWNAGEPRFVFYPPLSWDLGAALGLVLTHLPGLSEAAAWTATPIVYTWIVLTLAGLTLHRLAREFAGSNAAIVAAALYLANPYMLFNAYERTAYAELLAAAWMPLLLHAILAEEVTVPGIALPVTLLWLTNAPAAVMGCYTLAFLALIRIFTGKQPGAPGLSSETWTSRHLSQLRLARTTTLGTLLGLALAAFYIFPAAYERRWVQIDMATVGGMNVQDNFLFHRMGSPDSLLHDAVLHSASLIAVTLLALTVAGLAASFALHKKIPYLSLTLLAAGIGLLLTPPSLPLWKHLPEAAFLQFPWRLLTVLAPVCALALAGAFDALAVQFAPSHSVPTAKRYVGLRPAILAAAALGLPALLTCATEHLYRQRCFPEDAPPARVAEFHANLGTEPTDEYTPTDADNDALGRPNPADPDTPLPSNDPPYWLADTPTQPGPSGQPERPLKPGPAPLHLALTVPKPEFLILDLRAYPAWHVTLNHALAPTPAPRPDGLIALALTAGTDTIDIAYTRTLDQTIGDALSLISVPLFLFTTRRPRRP